MGINNPVPRSLGKECRKAARILASFIKPNQILGQDLFIPPDVLSKASGLAIITQLKAGFLFSGRAGSGVIVARLPDGSWSAPSAIFTAGAGVGGQIGAELTDFVFVLNNKAAVKTFAQAGSITLGGNVSLAAGPLGRNAEAAGSASLGSVAAIFAYSKTKGLFAGISVEGSVLIERRDANRKFYGSNCTAKQILSGQVEPPASCDPLFIVLESRAFQSRDARLRGEDFYNDIPDTFNDTDSSYSQDRTQDEYTPKISSSRRVRGGSSAGENVFNTASEQSKSRGMFKSSYSDYEGAAETSTARAQGPGRPEGPKPNFGSADTRASKLTHSTLPPPPPPPHAKTEKALARAQALFKFEGEQEGDLSFSKGDMITIIEKSGSQNDWWTGSLDGRRGIFPANYVQLIN